MRDLPWSSVEKKIARRAYDDALGVMLGKIMVEFKTRAADAKTPQAMWNVEGFLRKKRLAIDETFSYRYSGLLMVFAIFIREGHLDEARLSGLSDDKRAVIRKFLSLSEQP
jgi:hypothetical protein